jgi:hypothetical protein
VLRHGSTGSPTGSTGSPTGSTGSPTRLSNRFAGCIATSQRKRHVDTLFSLGGLYLVIFVANLNGMAEKSLGDAILGAKCPRCRKGDMFVYPWHRISKFFAVNKQCPVCKLLYEIEPGFFFGAMYMSYAFIVAIFAIVGATIYYALDDPGIIVYIIGINLVVLILLPLIFRYSRVLYLYLFGGVSYEKDEY